MELDAGFGRLKAAVGRGDKIIYVHYACEDFYDDRDHPTPITCIAVVVHVSMTQAFAVANAPQSGDVATREKDLLKRYFDFMKQQADSHVVHWNMHSASYGFQAIADRYRYLLNDEPPFQPQTDRLYDLDAMITVRFGEGYADHPKLRNLASVNNIYMPFFKAGKDEAVAAKKGDYSAIEKSTSEKAHIISALFNKLHNGTLRTRHSVGSVSFASDHLDAVQVVLEIGRRFLYVQRSLKQRYSKRSTLEVNDEHDAQDLFRSLLRLFFDNVKPEEWTPSTAGAATRIDFILPEFNLAIELKHARGSLDAKALGEELIVDSQKYAKHPDVQHLVCVVFDHEGSFDNPRGIEKDLGRQYNDGGLAVTVQIIDR